MPAIGTTPCPQIMAQYGDHDDLCPNVADVFDVGPDADSHPAYKCTCLSGHEQFFDQQYYDLHVTGI